MNVHVKSALMLVVLGVIGIVGYKLVWPLLQERAQLASSDAKDTKGRIVIGYDSWIGYFPLCSAETRKRMRLEGYVVQCEDDQADIGVRMRNLADGKIDLAVATVDAYLTGGAAVSYPGTVVAVIDESKGGDAIVAWKDRIPSLDALKQNQHKIAYTANSPSEHLLRAAAVHFDLRGLLDGGDAWRVPADGSSDALKRLQKHEVDAAVLWEPDVARALALPGVVRLLSTADTSNLIVDVLIVNRNYSQQHADAVSTLLRVYFDVLRAYRDEPERLERDVAEFAKLDAATAKTVLSGVSWASLSDNVQTWLGATTSANALVDTMQSTLKILNEAGALSGNPLPDQDPFRIINRQFVGDAYVSASTGGPTAPTGDNSLQRRFAALSEPGWSALREIGTLKSVQVMFGSGTAELSYDGKTELDRVMETLVHYPNFRVQIRGHTGIKGDPEANKLLSQERADAVARYLNVTYGVDPNRLRVVGMGSEQPLPRLSGESDRAYNYRLPRVELSLLSEVL